MQTDITRASADALLAVALLLTAAQGARLLGISERRFHELRHESGFPLAVLLGPRCVRWHRAELVEFAQRLPRVALLPEPQQLKSSGVHA
jgi:predicted DNA-binding transcriptional regulator AlpA